LFNIKKDDSLTLGIKSSSLSFKAKVDLLRDLNRISIEDQKYFVLFMEIRNKLIHNLSIDTMLKAVKSIDKLPQLIKALNEDSYSRFQKCNVDVERELILITAFHGLAERLHKIILDAFELHIEEYKKQSELEKAKVLHNAIDEAFKLLCKAIDKFSESFDEVYNPEHDFNIMEKDFAKKIISTIFLQEVEKVHPDIKDYYKKPTELNQPENP